MKTIIKGRWVIFVLWLVTTVLLSVFQPDINAILAERGQSPVSSQSPSMVAKSILAKMETATGTDNLIVFYDENKLSDTELQKIQAAVADITNSSAELGISNIFDPFSKPEAKSSLVSEDETTLMVSFKLDKGSREISAIKDAFSAKLQNSGVDYYLTGEDFINQDYLDASVAGVEKSSILTVLFILIILIIVFRSVITPVISLLAVAFSYLASMGIVAQLIAKAGFPVTTLTQILLVLILFGIGTDYNILLFNRFKEELAQGISVDEAIIKTYRTAGKTIAFSALTVLIAFLGLIFSKSPIFQSGIAVVIGVAVLLVEIMTLTPFAMKTLGTRIFWPSKTARGHKESKLWAGMSSFSTKRAVASVLVVVLLAGTTTVFYQQKLNMDAVSELGDASPSSKGFNIVAEHFGKGQAMPSTLVIEGTQAMDANDSLAVIDKLTENIKAINGVSKVVSVTQPQGKPIPEFYVNTQMSAVTDGLTPMQKGLGEISSGFTEAQGKLGAADFSQAGKMVDGTAQMQAAVTALSGGLSQLQAGLTGNNPDSETIAGSLAAIESNLKSMSGGLKELSANYKALQSGFSTMGTQYQEAAQALLGIKATLSPMQTMLAALGGSYEGMTNESNYLGLTASVDSLLSSLNDITPEGIAALNSNYNAAASGLAKANQNLELMSGGLSQMADGLKQIQTGLTQASDGMGKVITNMNSVAAGLNKMKAGQTQLVSGVDQFSTFGEQMTQVSGALEQISDGLGQSKDFLAQYSSEKTFYLPNEALTSNDFKASLDAYMSKDRTITKLIIVLDNDPYSIEATETIQKINAAAAGGLQGTVLSGAEFGVAGPSSAANDTNNVLNSDLGKMMIIVLTGVFLVLILVTRSFWTPVFITLSLLGTYYAAMFVTNSLFIYILHYPGISSFVPFFAFLSVVALGVDYSIFLMMRFKEYKDLTPKKAIVTASKQIGGVVMTAAIILGGTFATLIPSGMLILIELAVAVIVGLIVLSFIMLPIFLPATISLIDRLSKSSLRVAPLQPSTENN